jgi:hypothetical protein
MCHPERIEHSERSRRISDNFTLVKSVPISESAKRSFNNVFAGHHSGCGERYLAHVEYLTQRLLA